MLIIWQNIMFVIIILALGLTIYFSIRSRRQKEPRLRGLYAAKMNIFIGILLIAITLLEFTYPFSIARTVISAIFLLIGLFNLFAGIRNHSFYSRA